MHCAWISATVWAMVTTRTVQVRGLDDGAYTVLRTRAAAENLSLTAYLKRELEAFAGRPTTAEWLARVDRTMPKVDITVEDVLDAVHEVRAQQA